MEKEKKGAKRKREFTDSDEAKNPDDIDALDDLGDLGGRCFRRGENNSKAEEVDTDALCASQWVVVLYADMDGTERLYVGQILALSESAETKQATVKYLEKKL